MMELRPSNNENFPIKLSFIGEEVTILSAVFKEHIHDLITKGESDSIPDFMLVLAGWTDQDTENGLTSIDLDVHTHLTVPLHNFYDRTRDAIGEMASSGGLPPFNNPLIVKRYKLGHSALKLANDIEERLEEFTGERIAQEAYRFLANDEPSQ
jgi:hypothetical protein